MAKSFKGFVSNSGKIFDNMFDAVRDDFIVLLTAKSNNDAIARQLVGALTSPDEALDEFSAIVTELLKHRPARIAAEQPIEDALAKMYGEQPPEIYRDKLVVPDNTQLVHCMGGSRCTHVPGVCTGRSITVSSRDRREGKA